MYEYSSVTMWCDVRYYCYGVVWDLLSCYGEFLLPAAEIQLLRIGTGQFDELKLLSITGTVLLPC